MARDCLRSATRLPSESRSQLDPSGTMSVKTRSSTRICVFCNSSEDNELEYGKIYEHNGIVTHYYCLLLSSNMEQKGNDDEGILGFLAEDIQKELRRGKRLVCSYCRKSGATLGCCNSKCKCIFHFPCGLKNNSLHQFFGEFRSYCAKHRPKQQIDNEILKQTSSVDKVLCYICYDNVNTEDLMKTLWAPCCRKDAWFHRTCVQQLALSAGYFFKCPLCNNKRDFQKTMLEHGIFVPSQDASWELVPDAFQELLYTHNRCDASKCLCPKGRKYTSSNAKWELTLCRTCGSQGIHKACGRLKWANPIWDCKECTSILRDLNKHGRLDNDSTINGSSQTKSFDMDSKLHSDSDSDLELDSNSDSNSIDTVISVGTDFPAICSLASTSSISLLDSVPNVDLRPGPRSFKLKQQQQRIELAKCKLDIPEKDVTETSSEETNTSSLNNVNEKKEPSTSIENIPPQESVKEGSLKQEQSSSKNNEISNTIKKDACVIVIESDDDDDVELIELKRKTNVPPTPTQQLKQLGNPHIPGMSTLRQAATQMLINVLKNSAAKFVDLTNQSAKTLGLSEDDIKAPKPTVSKSEASNKSKSAVLDQVSVTTTLNSTLEPDDSNSNDLEELHVGDTDDTSDMGIKITNVTSLPPEVFESVPNVCNDITSHKNTTDTSSLSTSEVSTHVLSTKRSVHEVSCATDNYKKIKINGFDNKLQNTVSELFTQMKNRCTATNGIVANYTKEINKQQNKSTSVSNSNEIDKNNKVPLKSEVNAASNTYLLFDNQNVTLSTQSTSLHKADDARQVNQLFTSQLKGNCANESTNTQQSKENSAAAYGSARKYVTLTEGNPVFLQTNGFISSPFYLQKIANPNLQIRTVDQNAARTSETNTYTIDATPSTSIIMPPVRNNVTVLNGQPMLVNQPLMASCVNSSEWIAAPIQINKCGPTTALNQQEAAPKRNIPASIFSGNNSSNIPYCDGDAGTEAVPANRKRDDHPNVDHKSMVAPDASQRDNRSARSVFPQVTNNCNTCHQPRLIPRYMNLQDLKFQVRDSKNIQMTLYDIFSVNIATKTPKESKNRPAAASRKSRDSSILASREASCSSDYFDNIPTERQRSDKILRTSRNESCSVNDRSACARYMTRSQDDAKENLDPIRSRILSRSGILDNTNPANNIDDLVTTGGETDGETRLVSSDINLSALNETAYNTNADSITDSAPFVQSSYDRGSRVNVDVQQHKVPACNAIPRAAEERPGARLFCKETNGIVHNVEFDLNVINRNKIVEEVLQDDVAVLTSQRTDGDRISNDTDDSPTLRNGYKSSDNTNVMTKINNSNIAHVSNITRFNEHSISNKQIDKCDTGKFIQRMTFQENSARRNGETRTKDNEFSFKVSVDLWRIQSLIDSKPELFENQVRNVNQRCRHTNRLIGLDYCSSQLRYCDIKSSDGNRLSKSKELQKSNYSYSVEHMQRDAFPSTNTFLQYQKSNRGIQDFDKDILDR
ncbi:PREDICTED: uncharacterized protein LOC105569778 [Vollenhovia emeryi]|uniref:uncharacterized protein LOC105569778 n=1 Tax=Vollenhovia emeryi TaxID=411798 RepID=UPI0005F55214|nr:PREDICTED: uncharacterized protein LOC105569778 [Vollenhovia emeryi]